MEQKDFNSIGRVTVAKTLFLSKLNHLFISLPTPNKAFLSPSIILFLLSNVRGEVNSQTQPRVYIILAVNGKNVVVNMFGGDFTRKMIKQVVNMFNKQPGYVKKNIINVPIWHKSSITVGNKSFFIIVWYQWLGQINY